MLAIIGGTGLTKLANLEITQRQVSRTPYGEPSSALTFGKIRNQEIIFLARHGSGHTIPPHEVNYRANVWALHAHKVTHVLAIASVGGIKADLIPGALVMPDQIIDYTHGRKATYFDGQDKAVTHIDFTEPYSEELRQKVFAAAKSAGEQVINGGVYAAVQGPRLETAAEINRLERDGADMVGMTGMPEAALAKEIGLRYAAFSVVANYAAGRGSSKHEVRLQNVDEVLHTAMEKVRVIIEHLMDEL